MDRPAMVSEIDELAGRGGFLRNREWQGDQENSKRFVHGRPAFM